MASSSSDESSKAPDNFQVSSTSNDEDNCDDDDINNQLNQNIHKHDDTTTALKCFLCRTKQYLFICRACVRNGNFTYSKTKQLNETLSEKQQSFINIQGGLSNFNTQYDQIIKLEKTTENIQFQIRHKKEQLHLLQQIINEKRKILQNLREKRDSLHKANSEKRKNLPKYPKKVKELEDYVLDRIEKINILRDKHHNLIDNLQECAKSNINQLITYIFPIKEIVLKDPQRVAIENKREDADTIAALADAKNTSYIRGKWVFHGSGISEMQYRIVAPSLPANGDYTAYLDWLTDNKEDVPKSTLNEITPSRIAAFRIIGALTYTTQLIQLMSFYLDVPLPHKLAYGEFCKKLNEEQFLRKVSKLNSNIMYLAYVQNVQLRTLNENHTIENILAILDCKRSDLGRQGYHEVSNAPLVKSIDSLLLGIETATESESEDENSFRLDWEALPSIPVTQDIGSNNVTLFDAQQQHHLLHQQQQHSTIPEGLITSAANRLTSMFRWMK